MLPTSAEDENKGCKWETVEETEQFIREQCIGDGQLQVRMKSKPVPGVTVIEAPNTKKSDPLKEIKEVVKSKEAKKQEKKIEKIEQAVEDTSKKVEEVKKETVVKKQEPKVEKEKSKSI